MLLLVSDVIPYMRFSYFCYFSIFMHDICVLSVVLPIQIAPVRPNLNGGSGEV